MAKVVTFVKIVVPLVVKKLYSKNKISCGKIHIKLNFKSLFLRKQTPNYHDR